MTDLTKPDGLRGFLLEAATYFENRPTHGEDAAHWANVYNAQNCRKAAETIKTTSAEIKRLRSALEFYADPKTWTPNGHPQIDSDTKPIVRDGGKVAREALKGGA